MSLAKYASARNPFHSVPDAPKEYTIEYDRLDGGLNLWDLDYRMDKNQSPDMVNLWWKDGVLSCRDGQTACDGVDTAGTAAGPGTGYACAHELFHNYLFCHLGTGLYCSPAAADGDFALTLLASGVPAVRGTFFHYDGALFYKTRGYYKKIVYHEGQTPLFTVEDVTAYVPVTYINVNPATHAGDSYQPENRLSPDKTLWYNAATASRSETFTGDGTKKAFVLTNAAAEQIAAVPQVYVNGTLLYRDEQYTAAQASGVWTVTLATAPASGGWVLVLYTVGVKEYRLPVTDAESVVSVTVDGAVKSAGTDYTADLAAGTVTFATAPPVTDPATNNTVKITYRKTDTDGLASVMDCRYACVYGGGTNVLIVLGGCPAQPNAYFWNGNNTAMDAGYFPYPQYNFAGDANDPVTGFGVQNGYLMIFKERSIGRASAGTETVSDRAYPTLDYTNVNSQTGCDLPWSIRLIENNLVFCNTYQGVHYLKDTTPAYENNVECLSRNVNGSDVRPGLFHDVRAAGPDAVCCGDDGNRYWLCANGRAWVWDYLLSSVSKPSWFLLTNIGAADFFKTDAALYHLSAAGRLTRFERSYADYGGAIEKRYRFAVQDFGSYERLKDVQRVVFATRSDTDTEIQITWVTDYETRADLTPILCLGWRLAPRNLLLRYLGLRNFANTAVRKPGCRHVRHFTMVLENDTAYRDMSLVSARIDYVFQGRDR